MISMDVDVLVLKVDAASQRLMRKYTISVFANITTQSSRQTTPILNDLSSLDSIIERLDKRVFTQTLTKISDLSIIDLRRDEEEPPNLIYLLESVHEIDLDSPESSNNTSSTNFRGFRISDDHRRLVFDPTQYTQQTSNPRLRLLYLISLRVCLQHTTVQNEQIFSRECRVVEFNVDIRVEIGVDQLKFTHEKLTVTILTSSTPNRTYLIRDQHRIEFIDPTKPLINLKSFLNGSSLLTKSEEATFRLDQQQQQQRGLDLRVDESSGLVYAPSLFESTHETNDYLADVYVVKPGGPGGVQTRSKLVVRVKRVETRYDAVVRIERRFTQWTNAFRLDFIDFLGSDVFRNLSAEIKCLNVPRHICTNLFKFNQLTGWLQIHSGKLLNPVVYYQFACEKEIRVRIEIGQLFEFEVNMSVKLGEREDNEVVGGDTPRVYLINSTRTSLQFDLIKQDGSSNSSTGVHVARVKNMITNNQVIALGYRVSLSDSRIYRLELDDVQSLELNQLYAFDLTIGAAAAAAVLPPTPIYFIRFNPYMSHDSDMIRTVKFYSNLNGQQSAAFNLTKLESNYYDSTKSEFIQNIVILDRVRSNRLSDRTLRSFVRVDADMVYFDTTTSQHASETTGIFTELLGESIEIKVFKFVADKISLKVIRVFEYKVIIKFQHFIFYTYIFY